MKYGNVVLILGIALLLAGVVVWQSPAGAQSPEQAYTLDWWTVDGGGDTTFGGGSGYALGGTAGQPDPGVLTGGGYSLGGGFWRGGVPAAGTQYKVYLPLVAKSW